MSGSLAERVTQLHQWLQSDDVFEHFGAHSRGIIVGLQPVLEGLADVGIKLSSPEALEALTLMGALLKWAGTDYDLYVRTKGSEDGLHVELELRGHTGPVSEDISLSDLWAAEQRRNQAIVIWSSPGEVRLNASTENLKTGGVNLDKRINDLLEELSEPERMQLIEGLFNVVQDEVCRQGEF